MNLDCLHGRILLNSDNNIIRYHMIGDILTVVLGTPSRHQTCGSGMNRIWMMKRYVAISQMHHTTPHLSSFCRKIDYKWLVLNYSKSQVLFFKEILKKLGFYQYELNFCTIFIYFG